MFGKPSSMVAEIFDTELYYVDMLRQKLEQAYGYARQNLKASAVRQKRNYDHKVNADCFMQGDQVWLHTPKRQIGLSPKLQSFWDGPFVVIQVVGENIYNIQKSLSSRKIVVHRDRLYRYQGNESNWFRDVLQNEQTTVVQSPVMEAIPNEPISAELEGDLLNPCLKTDDTVDVDLTCHTEPIDGPNEVVVDLQDGGNSSRKRKPPQRYGEWVM